MCKECSCQQMSSREKNEMYSLPLRQDGTRYDSVEQFMEEVGEDVLRFLKTIVNGDLHNHK